MEKLEYNINATLNGSHSFSKIKDIYQELKDQIIFQDPIQKNKLATVPIVNKERGKHYHWELYQVNSSLIMIEILGNWQGYAQESNTPPLPSENNFYGTFMAITVHNPNIVIRDDIEKILEKY